MTDNNTFLFNTEFVFKFDKVTLSPDYKKISDSFRNLSFLDGKQDIIPIPDDVPGEFPRIIMNSRDGKWNFQITKERATLGYFQNNAPNEKIGFNFLEKTFYENLELLKEVFIETDYFDIKHTGIIQKFLIEKSDPHKVLSDKINMEIFKDTNPEIENIQILKNTYKVFDFNSIKGDKLLQMFSFQSGMKDLEENKTYLMFMMDMNNFKASTNFFKNNRFKDFFTLFQEEFKENINKF